MKRKSPSARTFPKPDFSGAYGFYCGSMAGMSLRKWRLAFGFASNIAIIAAGVCQYWEWHTRMRIAWITYGVLVFVGVILCIFELVANKNS